MLNRRRFLMRCAAAACLAVRGWPAGAQTTGPAGATLAVAPDEPGLPIARDFLGLSYESGQIPNADFFSPDNHSLLALIRRLGKDGVLRIGGNSSEFTLWRPGGDTSAPPKHHPITPDAIRRLAAFVRASGWKLIYGLNLGNGTPDAAAGEAAAVRDAVETSLLAFQIGNEPDLFNHNGLRPKTYGVQDYLKEWKTFADAVRARVPGAPLAGPDTASHTDWVAAMAQENPAGLTLLTHHYYAEGPASSPAVTIDRLLRSRGRVDRMTQALQAASRQARHPYRLWETNSCYGGGKYGVSDTFASALWGLDYLFQLASAGCAGVNFHGGPGGAYTPIARGEGTAYGPRPLYYAMLLFAQPGRGHLVPANLQGAPDTLTAYAARDGNALNVIVINRDAAQTVPLTVETGRDFRESSTQRLAGPSLAATTGVTLGEAGVGADGSWTPVVPDLMAVRDRRFTLTVPAASAVSVRLT